MKHFVCTGTCRGVATQEGVCQDVNCPHYGQTLASCDCADGTHHPLIKEDR
ncbi:MAG: hypothetical protein WDZ85_02785 [Candidatus Paceibacterota bacterium]